MQFTKEDLTYETGKEKEWLLANGLGGYASSSIINLNTRKYHGLLISATQNLQRYLQLSKVEEEIKFSNSLYSLGCNNYPNVTHPEGYKHLTSFNNLHFPSFTYSLPNLEIDKTILLPHRHNAVIIAYKILSKTNAELTLRPFTTARNIHELKQENQLSFRQQSDEKTCVLTPTEGPTLILGVDQGKYTPRPDWMKNIEYSQEQARGYDYREDLYVPGAFTFKITKGLHYIHLIAAGGKDAQATFTQLYSTKLEDYKSLFQREENRIKNLIQETYSFNNLKKDPFLQQLVATSDTFLISNKTTKILAGYPWFTDWGRDTLISLPGLCLVTGRIEEAKSILKQFARSSKNGLLPNYFDAQKPVYNSVDTSLWFIYAVSKFVQHTNNYTFVKKELWPTMKEIIKAYRKGTDFSIFMDKDGLLHSGDPTTNLTWMDAMIDGKPVVRRDGKAVEINALWYNALRIMASLASQFQEKQDYEELAFFVRTNFKQFWNPGEQCLYDVLRAEEKDSSVRPNQLFAVSLPYSLLDTKKEMLVIKKITQELLTPYGLRTLSPRDSRYQARCVGNQRLRDKAYHNGTVWPWLLGPYLTAYLKIHNHSELGKLEAEEKIIMPLLENFREAGIGTISEIYDADSLKARGCISQAWSVAELLRAYLEDVKKVHLPK